MASDPRWSLVDALPVAACAHRDGRVVRANAAFAVALGFADVGALDGKDLADLIHEGDRALVATRARDLSTALPCLPATNVRWLCADGQTFAMWMSSARMQVDGETAIVEVGPAASASAAPTPFAPMKQLASVVSLAAGVAHGINNPLTYVLASLDSLREQLRGLAGKVSPAVIEELDEMAAEAKVGADRVARIVHNLKIFSRVDEEHRSRTELHPVLEAACALASNEIRHRARLVKVYRPVPAVEANDARLTLVFFNLFINAVQAIQPGRAENNQIDIRTWTDQGRAIVEIRDTGCGIAPEHLSRVFDPFFTTRPQETGTGLGLSMCHSIVTALGGDIAVESTLSVGTTVRVSIPSFAGAPPPTPVITRVSTGNGRSGKILVIDDDAAICTAIRRTLGRRHQVTTTTSGREAVDRITGGERYDLILCDLMMPMVTGMEVHSELHQAVPEQADRIVFLTGGAFTAEAREFLKRIPNERFEKPFDGGRLRMLAKEMVDDTKPPPK
jgi:signal transduction histidine kinase/CheY-like chemotaxis protein